MWREYSSFVLDLPKESIGGSSHLSTNTSCTTSMEYDKYFDMLWISSKSNAGSSNGRITSYGYIEDDSAVADVVDHDTTLPAMYRYSSFSTHANDVVQQLLPNQTILVAVGQSSIGLSTYGGASVASMAINSCPAKRSTVLAAFTEERHFTCSDFLYKQASSRISSAFVADHIIVGASDGEAYVFDLEHFPSPVITFAVDSAPACIQSNGNLVCVGGVDGCVRFLDGQFRSSEVTSCIEAHSGTITDMCMQSDGRTLITCGTLRKPINPYDKHSPFNLSSDPQIKVFDMRMQRQLMPLSITGSGSSAARFLRFVPQVVTGAAAREYTGLLTCSAEGLVHINKLNFESLERIDDGPDAEQVVYAPLTSPTEAVSSLSVASSGQYMALGTSMGTIGQYVRTGGSVDENFPDVLKGTALFKVNDRSPNPRLAPQKESSSPLRSLSLDSDVLGSSYVLLPTGEMSSSFTATPRLWKKKMVLGACRRIDPELLRKVYRQDFIGIIPNPGFVPNSMICHTRRWISSNVSPHRVAPYSMCDPRRLELLDNANLEPTNSHHSAGRTSTRHMDAADQVNNRSAPGPHFSGEASAKYLKPSSSNSGKQRFKKFDYELSNVTSIVGLENNNVPNSFINPILQLFYSIPQLRTKALLSQLHPFHHQLNAQDGNQQPSLLCEMGFLFHMLLMVGTYSREAADAVRVSSSSHDKVIKVVRAVNFQRNFQSLQLDPEAAVLGLFDESLRSDLQQYIQVCSHFLLRHLSKEIEKENASSVDRPKISASRVGSIHKKMSNNVIDDVFGFCTRSSITFLHSGVHKIDPDLTRSLVLDLIYPPLSTSGVHNSSPNAVLGRSTANLKGRKGRRGISFASALWSSFQKEVTMKGWCQETEAFEPFQKLQSIESLPSVLLVQCGNTQQDVKDTSTLSGAMGDTPKYGSPHSNFWSDPLEVISPNSSCSDAKSSQPSRYYSWLPVELEIAYKAKLEISNHHPTGNQSMRSSDGLKKRDPLSNNSSDNNRLIISCRCVPASSHDDSSSSSSSSADIKDCCIWIIFDGAVEVVSKHPASLIEDLELRSRYFENLSDWNVCHFALNAVVVQVNCTAEAKATEDAGNKHLVLHIRKDLLKKAEAKSNSSAIGDWYLLNDFVVQQIDPQEVFTFPNWKHPAIVSFQRKEEEAESTSSHAVVDKIDGVSLVVPETVLYLRSLSGTPTIQLLQSFGRLPGPGDLVAFDGEFVSVSPEKSFINASGDRIVNEETRQVLARISLLDTGFDANSSSFSVEHGALTFNKQSMRVLADDYILPVEPVVDYVTRFSGITAEDLNPLTSRHSVLSQRSAYLKLRYFIDRKCIFVGHGLQKDFETANIFIPPQQVRDTVELWRLPNQRKISLRFLASYVLKEDIQGEVHDSIEDAKTAMLLYQQYKLLEAAGHARLHAVLQELYQYGQKNNWTIGMDRLHD